MKNLFWFTYKELIELINKISKKIARKVFKIEQYV